MAKQSNENKPYVSNYPPLADWLHALDARCDWQLPIGPKDNPNAYVEQYQAPGCRPFIVVVYANKHGWNIYTDSTSNKITDSLADANERIRRKVGT